MSPSEITSPFDRDVARIWALNQEERRTEALALGVSLVERYPNDPRSHFEYAGVLDFQGREADAVGPYQRAQALGLSGDDLPRLYVQLGSTLRNIGQPEEAVRFLAEGRERFPNHTAIRAFHALALVSAGRCPEAVVTLLELVTDHTAFIDLDGYDRALRKYTDAMRDQSSSAVAPRPDTL